MKAHFISQKLLIEEVRISAQNLKIKTRGMTIGPFIKFIRNQLGMSQKILSQRAGVPQSTISRIEQQKDTSLSTLSKILNAMCCDLIIVPVPKDSIDNIRRKQARKIAERQIKYLKGTMNLEDQQPDSKFIDELLKHEEEQLLKDRNAQLWNE
jgi:predicted DNA-binding mobile mystery protein A